MSRGNNRSVFVGNIPYEATEEQLREIFQQAGEVVSFRLVFDRETGKPKGFGFCEYKDAATAASAMRNLNGFDIGGRHLRVDTASDKDAKPSGGSSMDTGPDRPTEYPRPQTNTRYGASVPEAAAPTAISKTVQSIPPQELFEIMKKMKMLVLHDPEEARHFLTQNPQLCYALLMAQIRMKIIDKELAEQMLQAHARGPEPAPPTGPTGPGRMDGISGPGGRGPPVRMPPRGGPGPGPGGRFEDRQRPGPGNFRPPPQQRYPDRHFQGPPMHGGAPHAMGGPPMDMGRPPMPGRGPPPMQPARSGPPPPQQPPQPTNLSNMDQMDQETLLREIMTLTDAQIAALPPDQAQVVRTIKQSLG